MQRMDIRSWLFKMVNKMNNLSGKKFGKLTPTRTYKRKGNKQWLKN